MGFGAGTGGASRDQGGLVSQLGNQIPLIPRHELEVKCRVKFADDFDSKASANLLVQRNLEQSMVKARQNQNTI